MTLDDTSSRNPARTMCPHVSLPIEILPQPDEVTCGPTSLHAVYSFYGDVLPLMQVVHEVPMLEEGGTLAVHLACHARERGYRAVIHTVNMQVFDPTWFTRGPVDLRAKLMARQKVKRSKKMHGAIQSYLRFLELGGTLEFGAPDERLIANYLLAGLPILTGLSGTYLYQCPRERDLDEMRCVDDDVGGDPQGHFVVLCGYDAASRLVEIADPYRENPVARHHHYTVDVDRVLHAILLGILTYDANLVVIDREPT